MGDSRVLEECVLTLLLESINFTGVPLKRWDISGYRSNKDD